MRCALKTLNSKPVPSFFLQMSDRSMMLGMLRRGQTGEAILQILDTLVSGIEEENINDCAAHYAAISMPTLQEVAF
jgi:hypothetical protein